MARKANPKPSTSYTKKEQSTLKKELTPLQYEVTQKSATEPPFKNEYWNEKREGIYVDITTGEPLFSSLDKFDSGCGWPSFTKPIEKGLINEKLDKSHNMIRTEVRSKTGDAHLGHLFPDGPKDKEECVIVSIVLPCASFPRNPLSRKDMESIYLSFQKK